MTEEAEQEQDVSELTAPEPTVEDQAESVSAGPVIPDSTPEPEAEVPVNPNPKKITRRVKTAGKPTPPPPPPPRPEGTRAKPSAAKSKTPTPSTPATIIKVGDVVQYKQYAELGTVIEIIGDKARVSWEGSPNPRTNTTSLINLKLAPAGSIPRARPEPAPKAPRPAKAPAAPGATETAAKGKGKGKEVPELSFEAIRTAAAQQIRENVANGNGNGHSEVKAAPKPTAPKKAKKGASVPRMDKLAAETRDAWIEREHADQRHALKRDLTDEELAAGVAKVDKALNDAAELSNDPAFVKASPFTAWLKKVNAALLKKTGIEMEDLPDMDWSSWFADEMTPAEAVKQALEESGWEDEG